MWRKLLDHAQTQSKRMVDQNIVKHKDLLLHLKRNGATKPDIDVFNLQTSFVYFMKNIKSKINKIKNYCKENNLESALNMQADFIRLKDQLVDMENRSTVTNMVSCYINEPNVEKEDMIVYNNVSMYKQYFMLRKQYDAKLQTLAKVAIKQHQKITKYEDYIT